MEERESITPKDALKTTTNAHNVKTIPNSFKEYNPHTSKQAEINSI